jgi:hypothetical protein
MMEKDKVKKNWKQQFLHEFNEYWMNVIYMALVFSAIIFYRRLVLAHYEIYLNDYFSGVIKALVIAKVVTIGAFLRISRKFEHKPLIFPVLYKAVLFTLWVMVFDIVEAFIHIFINNPVLTEAFNELKGHMNNLWLGGALLIFFSFIPFFAFKELVRVLGKEKVRELFLHKHSE